MDVEVRVEECGRVVGGPQFHVHEVVEQASY